MCYIRGLSIGSHTSRTRNGKLRHVSSNCTTLTLRHVLPTERKLLKNVIELCKGRRLGTPAGLSEDEFETFVVSVLEILSLSCRPQYIGRAQPYNLRTRRPPLGAIYTRAVPDVTCLSN
jgi:hypothetical protein